MNNPEKTYDWQQPYTAAIWETDSLSITGRIYEALSAVEERRLSRRNLEATKIVR
jgi:hypothetical protein